MSSSIRHFSAARFITLSVPLLLGGATTVVALPTQEVETIYYSDADKTDEVGGSIRSCTGHLYSWGRRTRYASRTLSPCDIPNPVPGEPDLPCEFKAKDCGIFRSN